MAKVESANDDCFGAASDAVKGKKANKKEVANLVEQANKKNRFIKDFPSEMKKIVYKKIDGTRVPFILKNGEYVPMKIVEKSNRKIR